MNIKLLAVEKSVFSVVQSTKTKLTVQQSVKMDNPVKQEERIKLWKK